MSNSNNRFFPHNDHPPKTIFIQPSSSSPPQSLNHQLFILQSLPLHPLNVILNLTNPLNALCLHFKKSTYTLISSSQPFSLVSSTHSTTTYQLNHPVFPYRSSSPLSLLFASGSQQLRRRSHSCTPSARCVDSPRLIREYILEVHSITSCLGVERIEGFLETDFKSLETIGLLGFEGGDDFGVGCADWSGCRSDGMEGRVGWCWTRW